MAIDPLVIDILLLLFGYSTIDPLAIDPLAIDAWAIDALAIDPLLAVGNREFT